MITVYQVLLAVGIIVVFMLIYAGVEKMREERRKRRERRLGLEDDSGVVLRKPRTGPPETVGASIDDGFDRMVRRTGMETAPEQIIGLMALLAVVLAGGLYLWREQIGLAVLGFLLGLFIPLGIVWVMQGRYRAQLQQQLPDALYLIARSLRAGTSLEQAIQLVADDGPQPLAKEFRHCAGSLQLSLPMTTALQIMADRVNLTDFNAFVSAVSFHQTTGGNLPLILDRLAAGARDRNQFRGQFWAATAQSRITVIALAAAAPLLVLGYMIFQPDFAQAFLDEPKGWAFLGVVAILETIGIIWIWQILKIDY